MDYILDLTDAWLDQNRNLHFGKKITSDTRYGGKIITRPFSISSKAIIYFNNLNWLEQYLGLNVPGKIYDINIRKKPSGTVDLKAQYEIYNDDETISSLSKKEFNKIIGMCKSDT